MAAGHANQEACEGAADGHQEDLVNHDCRGALSGLLAASFHGTWISTPEATTRAADKIFQLTVARAAGLRVPETLVSQSKEGVLAFADRVGRIIVKPVVGAPGPLMFTQYGDGLRKIPADSFRSSPAIYQEYIAGDRHIRLNSFGEDFQAAMIQTSALDWRPDLNVPISSWAVPEQLADQIRRVLSVLNLRMGAIDIKLTPEGEQVWLEINPQGQFLFLEPILASRWPRGSRVSLSGRHAAAIALLPLCELAAIAGTQRISADNRRCEKRATTPLTLCEKAGLTVVSQWRTSCPLASY